MEYSAFSFEQIHERCGAGLFDVINTFLNLAQSDEIRDKMSSIFYKGGYGNYRLSTNRIPHRDNPSLEFCRRVSMAYLLLTNPTTFDILVHHNVNLFHGTNGNALPGILKWGLTSEKLSNKNGVNVVTGEFSTKMRDVRDFVSMTNILDIAVAYSSFSPKVEYDELLSFPVIIATSEDNVLEKTCSVHSDVPEVGIQNKLDYDSIVLIGVPSDKVNIVKKMVVNSDVLIVPMDVFEDRFYYYDDFQCVTIMPDLLEAFKNRKYPNKKRFSMSQIKQFVLEQLKKIKGKYNDYPEENKHGSR